MSGTPKTTQQVKLYMSYRNKSSQAKGAYKAGISKRTARRIDSGQHETNKQARNYRTRKYLFCRLFNCI